MLREYESVCYELLRPGQVKQIKEKTPIIYIPAGSLEWHGRQNPLGTDSLKAHAICCEAALRYGGVVLPPFYQGLLGHENWGPEGWEGYTLAFNEDEMLHMAMRGICRALVSGGWKVIVGVTGHDVAEQREALQEAIDATTDGKTSTGFALMEGELHSPDEGLPLSMDHAGAWETSCMMYAYPDSVDLAILIDSPLIDDNIFHVGWETHDFNPEGIDGMNPYKYSAAETGKAIISRMAEAIGRKALRMLIEVKVK
jgi:creatinine amidohydrolase